MVLNPLKIQENNLKKNDFGIYPGTKSPFIGPKNFSNFFLKTIEKKIKTHR
jgi:hypothetical protein